MSNFSSSVQFHWNSLFFFKYFVQDCIRWYRTKKIFTVTFGFFKNLVLDMQCRRFLKFLSNDCNIWVKTDFSVKKETDNEETLLVCSISVTIHLAAVHHNHLFKFCYQQCYYMHLSESYRRRVACRTIIYNIQTIYINCIITLVIIHFLFWRLIR